jgi:hypothetical protein
MRTSLPVKIMPNAPFRARRATRAATKTTAPKGGYRVRPQPANMTLCYRRSGA